MHSCKQKPKSSHITLSFVIFGLILLCSFYVVTTLPKNGGNDLSNDMETRRLHGVSDSIERSNEAFQEQHPTPLKNEAIVPAITPQPSSDILIEKAPEASTRDKYPVRTENLIRIAGNQTFHSTSGQDAQWIVESFSQEQTFGTKILEKQGREISVDLPAQSGKETIYKITSIENGQQFIRNITVLPVNMIASFIYESEGNPPVKTYVFIPESISAKTRLLTAIHDSGRSGYYALAHWVDWAAAHDYIIIAPEFPYPEWSNQAFNEGNLFVGDDGMGSKIPKEKWSFTIANVIALKAINEFGLSEKEYDIFGHSGGGRFTHRFMMFVPDAPIRFAFPANPGVWTMPTFEKRFPWGLKHPHFSYKQEDLIDWTNRKIIIVRGMDDVYRDDGLEITAEGDEQGQNRFIRAQNAFDMAKKQNPNFAWELLDVPDCGHASGCTAAAAQQYLESHLAN